MTGNAAAETGPTSDDPVGSAEAGSSMGEDTGHASTSASTDSATDGTAFTSGAEASTGEIEVFECQVTMCGPKVYACGDCIDNDGDGLVDAADPSCWGPCDNNEVGWNGNIPGQGTDPCVKVDCYFDGDRGSGNDDCHWAGRCDPLDSYGWCAAHDPGATIPGASMTCEEAMTMQSPQCASYCGPLVPNGCDCFGCCEVILDGQAHTVFLDSASRAWGWEGSCGPDTVTDPTACAPCTQVPACLNPCEAEACEICFGQTTLPDGCDEAQCPPDVEPCLPEHASGDCAAGMVCVTGCCIPFPL